MFVNGEKLAWLKEQAITEKQLLEIKNVMITVMEMLWEDISKNFPSEVVPNKLQTWLETFKHWKKQNKVKLGGRKKKGVSTEVPAKCIPPNFAKRMRELVEGRNKVAKPVENREADRFWIVESCHQIIHGDFMQMETLLKDHDPFKFVFFDLYDPRADLNKVWKSSSLMAMISRLMNLKLEKVCVFTFFSADSMTTMLNDALSSLDLQQIYRFKADAPMILKYTNSPFSKSQIDVTVVIAGSLNKLTFNKTNQKTDYIACGELPEKYYIRHPDTKEIYDYSQKQVSLYRTILQIWSQPFDNVLEIGAGTGTVHEACAYEKCNCISIECDKDKVLATWTRLNSLELLWNSEKQAFKEREHTRKGSVSDPIAIEDTVDSPTSEVSHSPCPATKFEISATQDSSPQEFDDAEIDAHEEFTDQISAEECEDSSPSSSTNKSSSPPPSKTVSSPTKLISKSPTRIDSIPILNSDSRQSSPPTKSTSKVESSPTKFNSKPESPSNKSNINPKSPPIKTDSKLEASSIKSNSSSPTKSNVKTSKYEPQFGFKSSSSSNKKQTSTDKSVSSSPLNLTTSISMNLFTKPSSQNLSLKRKEPPVVQEETSSSGKKVKPLDDSEMEGPTCVNCRKEGEDNDYCTQCGNPCHSDCSYNNYNSGSTAIYCSEVCYSRAY